MKSSLAFLAGLSLVLMSSLINQTKSKSYSLAFDNDSQTVVESESRSPQTAQRGLWQPRESRLYLQLSNLTEEQTTRIDGLHKTHREQVEALLEKLQSDEIDRTEFLLHRRTIFNLHQEELRQVLTPAQWLELQNLRAERRNQPRNN